MSSLSPILREAAQVMAWELESSRLRVGLAPSQIGREWRRRIRVVEETNPEWYQRFCAEHSNSNRTRPRKRQKADTYIKRAHTLRALHELASGQAQTIYAERLLPYVVKESERYEQESATGEADFTAHTPQSYAATYRDWPGRTAGATARADGRPHPEVPPARRHESELSAIDIPA